MTSEIVLYAITTVLLFSVLPILWRAKRLTILRIVIVLFVWDSALTIEAATFADIVFIGVLHIMTIPAFLVLLYLDLTKQSKASFTCFVCSLPIKAEEESETVSRIVNGLRTHVSVHSSCIEAGRKEKKALSAHAFRRGIPK